MVFKYSAIIITLVSFPVDKKGGGWRGGGGVTRLIIADLESIDFKSVYVPVDKKDFGITKKEQEEKKSEPYSMYIPEQQVSKGDKY